jgi:hypothetical protein
MSINLAGMVLPSVAFDVAENNSFYGDLPHVKNIVRKPVLYENYCNIFRLFSSV